MCGGGMTASPLCLSELMLNYLPPTHAVWDWGIGEGRSRVLSPPYFWKVTITCTFKTKKIY